MTEMSRDQIAKLTPKQKELERKITGRGILEYLKKGDGNLHIQFKKEDQP